MGGRSLGVRALREVEADPGVKQLPALLAACGKIKGTRQLVFGLGSESPANDRLVARFAGPSAQAAAALRVLVDEYRANLTDMVARVGLPHELPPPKVIEAAPAGQPTGPMKTELRRAFAPLGYDCRAESGAYTLRRRTRGNLTVEVYLDVGSWSRSLSGYFAVHGMGFTQRLPLPVSPAAWGGGQYPIDGPERWRQIVDNLAVSVAEYDRSFVPAIEAICGPIPDWHRLET